MDHTSPSGRAAYPRVADTEVALLASTAALALDRKLRKKPTDLGAVGQLVVVLSERLAVPRDAPTEIRAFLDPITTAFFKSAFMGSEFDEPSSGGLRAAALSFLERLGASEGASRDEELRRLRDACVAISRTAQASLSFMVAERPEHPYRR